MPQTCIKLTDHYRLPRLGTLWTPGVWNPAGVLDGRNGLCSPGFYHAYDVEHAATALLVNPAHANIAQPRIWLAEWRGKRADDGALKMGATEMRIVEEITDVATPTPVQCAAFAIYVARLARGDMLLPKWLEWSDRWLSGEDRSVDAARAAGTYAYTAYAAHSAYYGACAAHAVGYPFAAAVSAADAARSAAPDREMLATATAWALAID